MDISEVKELVNQCSDVDLRHTHDNLAWGVVGKGEEKDWVYSIVFDSAMTVKSVTELAATLTGECVRVDYYGSEAPVCFVYTSSDMSKGFCVVMSAASYMSTTLPVLIGDMDLEDVVPIFTGDKINLFADYFVPMAKVGSSYTPVAWLSPSVKLSADDIECGCNETQVIDMDWFSDCYTKVKNHYPSVDLDIADSERFVGIGVGGYTINYNRNHVGHQGNTSIAKCMLPVGIQRARLTGRPMYSNIVDIYKAGADADAWKTAQILRYEGVVGEVKEEDAPTVKKFVNAGTEKPENPGTTPLSRSLFGATGGYKN